MIGFAGKGNNLYRMIARVNTTLEKEKLAQNEK